MFISHSVFYSFFAKDFVIQPQQFAYPLFLQIGVVFLQQVFYTLMSILLIRNVPCPNWRQQMQVGFVTMSQEIIVQMDGYAFKRPNVANKGINSIFLF